MRIENDVDTAGVFVFVENLGPGLTAIAGAENSPLLVRPESVAESGHQSNVGIGRVYDQRPDLPRIPQANVFPVLSAID